MNTAPFHIAYGTAKAAVAAMTRTMAVELALDNIRVNAVAPGVTETAASRTYVDADPDRDRQAIAMGRRGRPEEQAGAILFLLSDLSSYITGQTLLVDGGLNLKWSHLGADNTSLFLKDESFRRTPSSRFQEIAMSEEVLIEHAGVSEACVVGAPDEEWGEVVVAFIVGTASAGELDAHLLERIARFKRPKRYEFVDEIPKNSYGKVLKRELRSRLA